VVRFGAVRVNASSRPAFGPAPVVWMVTLTSRIRVPLNLLPPMLMVETSLPQVGTGPVASGIAWLTGVVTSAVPPAFFFLAAEARSAVVKAAVMLRVRAMAPTSARLLLFRVRIRVTSLGSVGLTRLDEQPPAVEHARDAGSVVPVIDAERPGTGD